VDDGIGLARLDLGLGGRDRDAAFRADVRSAALVGRRDRGRLRPQRVERALERVPDLREADAVLRALRPREARLDRREVERQDLGVVRLGDAVPAEEALLPRVGLDERDARLGSPREPQVGDRRRVERERAARRAVLGRHVRDRRAVGERELGEAGTRELDELPDDAVLPQHLGDAQDEVGRVDPFGQAPDEPQPTTCGMSIESGWPEHRRLGLDTADAPPEDAEAVDHRRVGVRADERVGEGPGLGPSSCRSPWPARP
jgi:hypothetical protein